MRPENIQAWAERVEFGHPPPSQPPFDEYGTPELFYHDAKAYPYRIGKRVAEIAALKQFSQKQKILLRNGEVKETELPNASKAEPSDQDAEAYLNRQRKILFQNGGAKDLKPPQKAVPPNADREAYMNQIRKRQKETAELERMTRQRKILFPNSVPEDPKPEPGPYRIPTRKPVPKSNDTTPPPPQMVLLRNGETRRLENIPSYAERVRDLGYPETLCPLAVKEIGAKDSLGIDCTGGKVVKERDDGQNQELNTPGRSDGTHPPQTPSPAPEPSLLSRETLALALRPAGTAIPNSVSRATIRDVVDMGFVTSSTRF